MIMKPHWNQEYEAFLEAWKEGTLQEHETIESESWDALAVLQDSKKTLMKAIETFSKRHALTEKEVRGWFAATIETLLELEKQNTDLLTRKQAFTRQEMDRSRSSGLKLNQIKSAYTTQRESVMIRAYS
jgi:hypothetical protein